MRSAATGRGIAIAHAELYPQVSRGGMALFEQANMVLNYAVLPCVCRPPATAGA